MNIYPRNCIFSEYSYSGTAWVGFPVQFHNGAFQDMKKPPVGRFLCVLFLIQCL